MSNIVTSSITDSSNKPLVAILFDVDNIPPNGVADIIRNCQKYGDIAVKRAYGNWSKQALAQWAGALKKFGIRGVQVFDYVSKKNASDIALVIDAMELQATGRYSTFIIVSSDSDFTLLAIRLREHGATVIGMGKTETSASFRAAVSDFIEIGKIVDKSKNVVTHAVPAHCSPATGISLGRDVASFSAGIYPQTQGVSMPLFKEIQNAWLATRGGNGWAKINDLNGFLAKRRFSVRQFGFKGYKSLFRTFPALFEIDSQTKGVKWQFRIRQNVIVNMERYSALAKDLYVQQKSLLVDEPIICISDCLRDIFDSRVKDEGIVSPHVSLAALSCRMKKLFPGFQVADYGAETLTQLLEQRTDFFKVTKTKTEKGGVRIEISQIPIAEIATSEFVSEEKINPNGELIPTLLPTPNISEIAASLGMPSVAELPKVLQKVFVEVTEVCRNNKDKWSELSAIGTYIKENLRGFNPGHFGEKKLTQFFLSYPSFFNVKRSGSVYVICAHQQSSTELEAWESPEYARHGASVS